MSTSVISDEMALIIVGSIGIVLLFLLVETWRRRRRE